MKLKWLFVLYLALPTHAILRTKFQHWFPKYESLWIRAVEGPCRQDVFNYLDNDRTNCKVPCACVADCVLQNITGTIQSNLASAQVLLGLVPVTAGFFGPTIAEVAVLSTYRPLLAVLLAIGSPAVNISRTFRGIDVCEPFNRPRSGLSRAWAKWLARQPGLFRMFFKMMIYVMALAAVANNIRNSIDLDLRTISGWQCAALYMPLVWSTIGVVVQGWGMIDIRLRRQQYLVPSLKSTLQSETFRSMNTTQDSLLSEGLFWMASFTAVIHMTYGTLVLSSLVFISALEAVQVFAVYAASIMVCQLILLLEMANMRHELDTLPAVDFRMDPLVSS